MVQAYIFVNVKAGTADAVVKKLRKKKYVKTAHLVTGLHDAIVFIQGTNLKDLTKNITKGVHKVPGITKTVTCVVVNGK